MIKRHTAAVLLSFTIGLAAIPPSIAAQADTRKELSAAIAEATKLLKGKDYVGFIQSFMRPDELAGLLERYGTTERLAADYAASDKPATMLKGLEAAASIEPVITAGGTRADFTFAEPIDGERRLSFRKIGDRWYIRN